MRDDFGVRNIVPIKVALTWEQVREMRLPPQMKAKAGSSRRKKFVERHGDDMFELEAAPPARLQAILRAAIDQALDVEAYNAEIEAEKRDVAYLDGAPRRCSRRSAAYRVWTRKKNEHYPFPPPATEEVHCVGELVELEGGVAAAAVVRGGSPSASAPAG